MGSLSTHMSVRLATPEPVTRRFADDGRGSPRTSAHTGARRDTGASDEPRAPVPDVGPRGVAPDPGAIEPVYFVSGLNFPVGRLGALGAVAVSTIPFAVGLDAMRQLTFPDAPGMGGTPPPEVELLILAVMTVFFVLLARWMIRTIERLARREGTLGLRWQ